MIYFTKQMWAVWQREDIDFADADDDWKRRAGKYWKQFKRLEPRLGMSAAKFLRTARLHDATVVNLTLDQRLLVAGGARHGSKPPHPMEVRIQLLSAGKPAQRYELRYRSVRLVRLDYPSDEPLFYSRGLGDWGYDEVTAADRKFLRHEVLFASGATLMIEFQRIVCRKVRPRSVRKR